MPTETPTIEVTFVLDGDRESYVARIRSAQDRQPVATFNLPRAVVDTTVLDAAQPRLEVRLDGTVAAYLDSGYERGDQRKRDPAGWARLEQGSSLRDRSGGKS